MKLYQVFNERRIRMLFACLFVLVPFLAIVIGLFSSSSSWDYAGLSIPKYISPDELVTYPVDKPEYAKLVNACFMGDYAQEVNNKGDLFFYVMRSCDSTDTVSPAIVLRMHRRQHLLLQSEEEPDAAELVGLLEGKLVKGFHDAPVTFHYLRRVYGLRRDNMYVLHAGLTPERVRERLLRNCLILTGGMLGGILLLYILMRYMLKGAANEAERKRFMDDLLKGNKE